MARRDSDRDGLGVASALALARQSLGLVMLPENESDTDQGRETARACNGHPVNHAARYSMAHARHYLPTLNLK
jgi:hypothetical protein